MSATMKSTPLGRRVAELQRWREIAFWRADLDRPRRYGARSNTATAAITCLLCR